MDKKEIFKGYVGLSTTALRKLVKNEFKENGTVAFEHGFKQPATRIKGELWRCSHIDYEGAHLFRYGVGLMTRTFEEMTRSQLIALCKAVNKYYSYCVEEA